MIYLLLLIAIALIFARMLGYLIYRIKQPAVIGEIIAGILLGAVTVLLFSDKKYVIVDYVIELPELTFHTPEFNLLAEIGILFLLFISGLETNIKQLKKTGKVSSFVALGGVIAPLVLGILSGLLFGLSLEISVIIGLILTATSVGVTVRTLMDLNALNTEVGSTILGAAVIDDVIGIVLLAFALGIGSIIDAVWIGLRIAIFFILFLYLGLKIIDKILDISEKIHLPKAFLSITLSILLLYAFFADRAGISGIIGAFVAGLLIGQNIKSRKIIDDIKTIGYGFFIPIFFVWVGTTLWEEQMNWEPSSIVTIIIFSAVLITVSIIGKVLGCGLAAKLSGLNNLESIQIGIGMIPRMELALIIVSAAISNGIISGTIGTQLLATTILLTITTTIITPILIKTTFKTQE